MRRSTVLLAAAALTLVATSAMASYGGGDSEKKDRPAAATTRVAADSPRAEAERLYAQAYDEVARARKDLADGKVKNAEKKLAKVLEWAGSATDLDPGYHEAWNLVGYAARGLKDYDRAFAAYGKCLELKPDYAPAREYLGEAWLDRGDAAKAREQLEKLENLKAVEEAKTLRAAIEAYEKAQGESKARADGAR
jgi:tetratricopeptide (TPR) repeat protein